MVGTIFFPDLGESHLFVLSRVQGLEIRQKMLKGYIWNNLSYKEYDFKWIVLFKANLFNM